MIPQKTIEDLINKHSILEKDLSSGKIDKKIFAEKSKEYSDLNEIVEDAKNYVSFEKDKLELEKILEEAVAFIGPVLVEVDVNSVGEMPRYFVPPPHALEK